jgi:hypothetical protein
MKNYFLTSLFFLFISHFTFSQVINYPIVKEVDLNDDQWNEWNNLDTTWTKNIMPVCLFENDIKLNCAKCESVYLKIQMEIDSTGKMVKYTKIKGNMCGNDFTQKLEKCFLDFFMFLEFPKELRNIILEVNIGNGLKC